MHIMTDYKRITPPRIRLKNTAIESIAEAFWYGWKSVVIIFSVKNETKIERFLEMAKENEKLSPFSRGSCLDCSVFMGLAQHLCLNQDS